MVACKNCEYWVPFENDPQNGTCNHPERDDKKCVYFYGKINEENFCAKFSPKDEEKE